ncbi:unnamed protein product [Bodo saltans]|uniref:Uncharacterized protein n=1 Tax=Bodo saltans TaxID=75058 RepID=A0A0S4JVH2_BODSA|nr:unnamed protein product [Bodo saltans]|eukprot:CUG94222.1 unnamed protein product [Bodo saltans]
MTLGVKMKFAVQDFKRLLQSQGPLLSALKTTGGLWVQFRIRMYLM